QDIDTPVPAFTVRFKENYETIYGSDAPFPESPATFERCAGFRKYNLVDIRVCPFQYHPVSGRLVYYPDLKLIVSFDREINRGAISGTGTRGTGSGNPGVLTPGSPVSYLPRVDHSVSMEAQAAEFIINYEQARAWYPSGRSIRGDHEFVIITTSSLVDAVQPLVDIEQTKGRTTYVATTDWIASQYTGRDLAEKIRTFLREKYPSSEWGITDVCLVGHYNDVPMREVDQDLGYGAPLTDFYYSELSGPDSVAWDSNSNNQWWDNSDAAEYYNEINVGRIPWSNWNTVHAICQKSADFELNDDPVFKNSILFLGTFFWEDTDNAVLMEAIAAEPWMSGWNQYRMYEQNSTVYSTYPCDVQITHANVRNEWSNGTYCFVDWAGHGSPTSAHMMGYGSDAFIDSSDCSLLNDDYPAIIFADACSNSDTDYTNIGAAMLQQGAVGFVGATKVALGCPGWNDPGDGSSQSMDYFFATAVTSTDHSQGEAHQIGLRNNYLNGGWDDNKYEIAEWNIWGNPDLGLVIAISGDGVLSLDSDVYGPNMQLGVTVRDMDLNGNPGIADTATVTVATSAGNDSETLVLTETGPNTAVFSGLMNLSTAGIAPGNGQLEIQHGETVTVTYIDADDGHGGINIPKTVQAAVDTVPPMIGNVTVTEATYNQLTIEWDTDEASDSIVFYGTGIPNQQAGDINHVTHHVVTVTDLDP
nr:C25 family cysteine peptidase [bacterium]